MNVKSAYLHSQIMEEIYPEQPSGFDRKDPSRNKTVCRLDKSIYGLKQAAQTLVRGTSERPHSAKLCA